MRNLRRLTWFAVLLLLGTMAASAQAPASLRQAVRERQKAVEAADAKAWDRLTSKNFMAVNAEGRLTTKAERLADIKRQMPQSTSTARAQEQLDVYGNVAVERVRSGKFWVFQVWVKQPQGWQVVATQLTTAAEK